MRPREVASRKVVARYGYVENPRISPAKAELLIAVQAKQQYVVLICELYSLDGLTLAGAGLDYPALAECHAHTVRRITDC